MHVDVNASGSTRADTVPTCPYRHILPDFHFDDLNG